MKVKFIKSWACSPNGYDRQDFAPGDFAEGKIAQWALESGVAEEVKERKVKI